MDAPAGEPHGRCALATFRELVMPKATSHLANRFPKTCWGCGKLFVVREGRREAIVDPAGRLYCNRDGCEKAALIPLVRALQLSKA
jgi:hypothetical protein